MAFETGVHVTSGLPRTVTIDTRVQKTVPGSRVRHQVGTGVHVSLSCFQTDAVVFGMRQIHIQKTPGLKRLAQQPESRSAACPEQVESVRLQDASQSTGLSLYSVTGQWPYIRE